jgi:hypothetical protein
MIDYRTGKPYTPQLSYYLGGLDIYDREHTLGVELGKFDMNNLNDRMFVLEKHCIDRTSRTNDYKKKFLLWNELKNALNDPDHNFHKYIEYNPDEYAALAYTEDELGDARILFEQLFKIATEKWSSELELASREDPERW